MQLTLRHISKGFDGVRAVDDVSLEVETAECFFLLGPSGCGKTTLLRIVAGFCRPDSGDVLFDGAAVTATPPHRRNTGMVFQNYALWPHMTVTQNVAFGLTVPGRRVPAGARRERVSRILETVRISHLAQKRPNQLSGGEQQRVALARALVIEPACLLLDEPLSNLDAKLRLEMRSEIRRLVKALGVTALYVTHDQKEALSVADRCAVMRAGRIEQVGAPWDLYNRPATPFVADFVGETNLLEGTVLALDAATATVRTALGDLRAATLMGRPAVGAAVLLSVRPEAIRTGQPPDGGPNAFRAPVSAATYLGESVQYELAAGASRAIKVLALNPRCPAEPSAEGALFWVAPEDIVVLPPC